jgi:hypothetical protein
VAVSEDVQNCADEGIYGGMGFSEDTQWKVPGEMQNCIFMKVQTNQQNAICRDVDQKKQ